MIQCNIMGWIPSPFRIIIFIYSWACEIPDVDSVILTGGDKTRNKVSRYNKDGWMEDLPDMIGGRWGHGCAGYKRGSEQVIYITYQSSVSILLIFRCSL